MNRLFAFVRGRAALFALAFFALSCGASQHPEPPAVSAHAAVHGIAHVIAAGDVVLAQRIQAAEAAPHAPGAVHAAYGALVDADDGAALAARLADDAIDHGGACAARDALHVLATRFALVLQLAADAGLGLSADAASAAGGIVTAADQFVPLCNVAVDAGGAQ